MFRMLILYKVQAKHLHRQKKHTWCWMNIPKCNSQYPMLLFSVCIYPVFLFLSAYIAFFLPLSAHILFFYCQSRNALICCLSCIRTSNLLSSLLIFFFSLNSIILSVCQLHNENFYIIIAYLIRFKKWEIEKHKNSDSL
jgi:hypothetical protein